MAEALADPKPLVPSFAPAKQPVRCRADPQIAATVDQESGNAATRRTLFLAEAAKAPVLVDRQTVGVRSDPHTAAAVLREARENAGGDAVRRTEAARGPAVRVVVQAASRGADPDDAVAVLE